MIDFEARHIIEALRSGVSSRATSAYFSSARPQLIADVANALEETIAGKNKSGMIITGKYGEGKTHFLNTIFNMAKDSKMVVSHISLSKETRFYDQVLVYQKLVSNTYLPDKIQPGFGSVFADKTKDKPLAENLLAFAQNSLETNKLYFLLKSYLYSSDDDEKDKLLADLEGNFVTNAQLKTTYKRIFSEQADYNIAFNKKIHCMDYFAFLSHFFLQLGYKGWVLLFDEAELIGRLSAKQRIKAYCNMADFLLPNEKAQLESTFGAFAFTASYWEDVVESKHEFDNLTGALPHDREEARKILERIHSAPQLTPLNETEILSILKEVKILHGQAYDWAPDDVDTEQILRIMNDKGYLLRTRIRAAVEFLDQFYQYGEAMAIQINELGSENYAVGLSFID